MITWKDAQCKPWPATPSLTPQTWLPAFIESTAALMALSTTPWRQKTTNLMLNAPWVLHTTTSATDFATIKQPVLVALSLILVAERCASYCALLKLCLEVTLTARLLPSHTCFCKMAKIWLTFLLPSSLSPCRSVLKTLSVPELGGVTHGCTAAVRWDLLLPELSY